MSKAAASFAKCNIRLLIPAGKASPSPPIGPALGAKGVKSMEFCKAFNDASSAYLPGTPLPTYISINPDKTFTFKVKTPTVTWFLLKAVGAEKGSGVGTKGGKSIGKVGLKTVWEIAKIKQGDQGMKAVPLYGICSSIVAQAKGLGIEIVY